LIKYLNTEKIQHEIIVCNDGSLDNTEYEIRKLRLKYQYIEYIKNIRNIGRGSVLNKGFMMAKGSIICYCDLDMINTSFNMYMHQFVKELKTNDIVIGSKHLPGAKIKTTLSRFLMSKVYNYMIRILFKSKIHCHQTGFKFLNKNILLKTLPFINDRRWFWDTELLLIGQKNNLCIKEIPITVDYSGESTIRPVRDVLLMFVSMFAFYTKGIMK